MFMVWKVKGDSVPIRLGRDSIRIKTSGTGTSLR